MWGGEFGRTPHGQGPDGRDHNAAGFSMWMAGGGVKGGMRYGATDEHGIRSVGKADAPPMTCTPPSCTCSVSTTNASPTATAAVTTA